MFHRGEDCSTDQNFPSRIALALGPIRARKQSTLRCAQSRHAFIDRLNPRADFFMLRHDVTSAFADALQPQCQVARA